MGKASNGNKERKRGKYKSDEVESMDKVQMLGEAFQKIQAATGIHVLFPFPQKRLDITLHSIHVPAPSIQSLDTRCVWPVADLQS